MARPLPRIACRALALTLAVSLAVAPVRAQLSLLEVKPPRLSAESYALMDQLTGEVVAEQNADLRLPPASLTKIMTAYLAFSAIKEGRLTEDQLVPISEKAWRMSGSRTFVEVGDQVSVRDLLLGVIVQSGNDASVALAEAIAGTEENFADLMNQQARLLGMENSRFENSTGLPGENHYSTARDMAILSRRTVSDFPEQYRKYSIREHTFGGITQPNRNGLLEDYPGADGLKTGYTRKAGYCLAASALRDDMRLVSVVMKTPSVRQRERDTIALFNFGFSNFRTIELFKEKPELKHVKVWGGAADTVPAGVDDTPIPLLLPRNDAKLSAEVLPESPIRAPVSRGDLLGEVRIMLGKEVLLTKRLVALADVAEGGWIKRARDYIKLNFLGGT